MTNQLDVNEVLVVENEENVYQISEGYAVSSDNYNVILLEKYAKMDGRGRNSNPTGEFGWRPAKCGSYYSNLDSLANSIKNKVEKETINTVGLDFDKFKEYMDAWLIDLKSHINENITLELGKVKEIKEDDVKITKKGVKKK